MRGESTRSKQLYGWHHEPRQLRKSFQTLRPRAPSCSPCCSPNCSANFSPNGRFNRQLQPNRQLQLNRQLQSQPQPRPQPPYRHNVSPGRTLTRARACGHVLFNLCCIFSVSHHALHPYLTRISPRTQIPVCRCVSRSEAHDRSRSQHADCGRICLLLQIGQQASDSLHPHRPRHTKVSYQRFIPTFHINVAHQRCTLTLHTKASHQHFAQ